MIWTVSISAATALFMSLFTIFRDGSAVFLGLFKGFPEAVLKADPQVILLLHPDMRAPDVARRVGWGGVAAVRQGRVYDQLDEDLFFRPGPRIVEGVVLLAKLLHHGQ